MARPKKIEGDPGVKEYLTEAFWLLLTDRPFRKITVRDLSTKAGVNHNSFYYHFENMEDLAKHALSVTFPRKEIEAIAPIILSDKEVSLPLPLEEAEPLFARVRLFAKPDSPELHPILQNLVESFWLSIAGLTEETINPKDRMVLSFISAGAIATLGKNPNLSISEFITLINSSIGHIVRNAIIQLSDSK